MFERRTCVAAACVGLVTAVLSACGDDSTTASDDGPGANGKDEAPSNGGGTPPPPPIVDGGDCASGAFEVRRLGTARYEEKDYDIVIATPCEYVLSYARRGVTYPIEETATHYVVDSKFELPYIPGVMDAVAFTPGDENKGWANGLDVEKLVAEVGPLPLLYHVTPGYEYGYFTDHNDGQGDIFGAFRPTWRFERSGSSVEMKVFSPPDTAWPRHRGGWNPREINQEIGFGFFVDERGRVYIPKDLPLGRKRWNDTPRCVIVNRGSAPIPITRTQFPGDESYYLAETLLPGYASIGSPGHKYWGHKTKPMRDAAKWDDTLPGNFDKPFGGGCDDEGYSVAHAEGFTWPELRDKQRQRELAGEIAAIPKEHLYRIKVYEQNAGAAIQLKGELWYEWDGAVWLPRAQGDALIPLDASRGTYRISGHLPEDRRAFVIVEDL
ncbi:MAG: hypothetical protein KF850_19180 [Labilithrix sp.]|nr:hypothetical protein [Labilithrix sp.]